MRILRLRDSSQSLPCHSSYAHTTSSASREYSFVMATEAESTASKDPEWEGVEHLDVAYGPDERHKIDFYQSASAVRASPRPALLIFIHG